MTAASEQVAFQIEGLGYVYRPIGVFAGLTLRATHIVREKQAVWVLLHVSADDAHGWPEMPGAPKRFNLFTSSSLASTARYFADAAGKEVPGPADWQVMIDAFAEKIVGAEKRGTPFSLVAGDEEDEPEAPDLVEKLIQAGQINLLFGPQGSAKGWIAMYLALCVQYGISPLGLKVRQAEVGYFDYEADRPTFRARLRAVGKSLGIERPRLRWMRPPRELVECIDWLSRMRAEEDIGLFIWDSVGRGTSAPGEHTTWEANAREVSAVAEALLPAALLCIDHVTGEATREKLAGKAMGGIRKMADARVAWECRLEQDAEVDHLVVGLWHSKFNNTRKFAPLGLRLDFESDDEGRATSVRFKRVDIAESGALSERLSIPERLIHALRPGKKDTNELASELGITPAHAKTELNALKRRGKVVALNPNTSGGRGKVQVWGLAETETVNRSPLNYSSNPTVSGAVPGPPENRSNGRDETVGATVSEPAGRVWWGDADDEGERF